MDSTLEYEAIKPLSCGHGRCTKCNCQGFEGFENTCKNSGCGHSYDDHLLYKAPIKMGVQLVPEYGLGHHSITVSMGI
jgi:hypothetical protein